MWRFIWWDWKAEKAHAHPQWGEATQVHTMQLCMSTGNHSEKAHQNTFFTKAIQINANGATSLQSQYSISTNIYSSTAEKSHSTVKSVGAHSVKHNIWKAISAFTLEENLISAQNTVFEVLNPLISNNKWSDIQEQLTIFVLRQHVIIVIYSATLLSTWATVCFYDFIIIITWYL